MTVRDIQHHLTTRLRVDISPDTISAITDAVLEEVMVWQQRELDEFYPVIFLDALRIKVRGGRPRDEQGDSHIAIGVRFSWPTAAGKGRLHRLALMGLTTLKRPCEAT